MHLGSDVCRRDSSPCTEVTPRYSPRACNSARAIERRSQRTISRAEAAETAEADTTPQQRSAVSPFQLMTDRVVIVMVGLPARGKSYLSKAIMRYLNFLGCPCRLFNAGNKRRDQGLAGTGAAFFDASNADAKAQREAMAMETLDDLLGWLLGWPRGCAVGIFDATNTTVARRRAVAQRCARQRPAVSALYVESVCEDESILAHNYQMKLGNVRPARVAPAIS